MPINDGHKELISNGDLQLPKARDRDTILKHHLF